MAISAKETLNCVTSLLKSTTDSSISPSPKNTKKGGRAKEIDDHGFYKENRKRGRCSLTSEIITSSPDHDGYQWRKYGEKKILNSQFPRCYYRCTYNREFNCKATKQVQQQDDSEPASYRVTYFSDHSCTKSTMHSDGSKSTNSQILLDFSAKTHCSPNISNLTETSSDNNGDCESLDDQLGSVWFDSKQLDFMFCASENQDQDFFDSLFENHDNQNSFLMNISECFMYD